MSNHELIPKEDIEANTNSVAKCRKRFKRSPQTRKEHAEYERRRVASMSPGKAAERKKERAEREKKRRNAMSETEKRQNRQKNAERMRKKRSESKTVLNSDPPVRKQFSIKWTSGFPPKYYTTIDNKEYFQYPMHALML